MEDKTQEKESQLGQMKAYKLSEISALRKELCDALSRLLEIESQMHSEKEKILKTEEFGDVITEWWVVRAATMSGFLVIVMGIIGLISYMTKGVFIIDMPTWLGGIFILIFIGLAWLAMQSLKKQGISYANTEDENLVSKYQEYVLSKWNQENGVWKNLCIEKDQLENKIKVLNERISAIQKEIDGLDNVSAFLFNA